MSTSSRWFAAVVGLYASQAAMAIDTTLTFDLGTTQVPVICSLTRDGQGGATGCSNGSPILQSYGDIPGVLDVQYQAPRATSPTSLNWWDGSYNNLYGVLWAPNSDADSQARITFIPLAAGSLLTLNSFDLGAWPQTSRGTTVVITEVGTGNTLFSYTGSVGNSNVSATSFAPAVSSRLGLQLTWQDSAYNNGIDNIHLSITPVPEAGSVAMALAGLGVTSLAWMRRRRAGASG
ncbi:MAG: hypothetical protein RLZZ182_1266 [Pseudomonadota bacterium]|jgi:hypothetical protein